MYFGWVFCVCIFDGVLYTSMLIFVLTLAGYQGVDELPRQQPPDTQHKSFACQL